MLSSRQPLPEGLTDGDSDCKGQAVSLRMLSSSVVSCVTTPEAMLPRRPLQRVTAQINSGAVFAAAVALAVVTQEATDKDGNELRKILPKESLSLSVSR